MRRKPVEPEHGLRVALLGLARRLDRTDPDAAALARLLAADEEAGMMTAVDEKTITALVALLIELRPDLGIVIAKSFVIEAIDRAHEPTIEDLHPDRRWRAEREARDGQHSALTARRTYARMLKRRAA